MLETWAFFVILYLAPGQFGVIPHGPFHSEGECKHVLSEMPATKHLLHVTPCIKIPEMKSI